MKQDQLRQLRQLREAIEASVLEHARMDEDSARSPEGYLRMVEACSSAARICDTLQKEAVQQARQADHSWATIGSLLGISRQAAQQRFASDKPADNPDAGLKTLFASAFNEMALLEQEGKAGNHLVAFGYAYIQVQASEQSWQHRREIALRIGEKRERLEADGWIYVGAFLPFHYFKRQFKAA